MTRLLCHRPAWTGLLIGVCVLALSTVLAGCSAANKPTPTTRPLIVTVTPAPPEPTDTPAVVMPDLPLPLSMLAMTPTQTAIPSTPVPELAGSFDVYLTAPDDAGWQSVYFYSSGTEGLAASAQIRTDRRGVVRAGRYVYFQARGSHAPQRVTTAGAVQTLLFAEPLAGASSYELIPSLDGAWLAWISLGADRSSYVIESARFDGSDANIVAAGQVETGSEIDLLRVTNDGQRIFLSVRPPGVFDDGLFNGYYELYMLDATTGELSLLPGEPACGEGRACDAYISPDGAYLARMLPPDNGAETVVVTDLTTGMVAQRFAPSDVLPLMAYATGYPVFTPGGELVYTAATGGSDLLTYYLVWVNIVTGEQQIIAALGDTRYRPLGWSDGGYVLLVSSEPGQYDTWQVDLRDGSMQQLSTSMIFLGSVTVPAGAP